MSEQIFYSAEGMVEAAADAQALVRAMEDTQSRFRTIKTMLNMSLSSVHELSITDRHVSFDKKNMQNQIDRMTRFAETLARAAEYTDSTNGYIRDNLDFFMSLLVSSMGTGVLAQSSAWMLNQHQVIAEISGTLPVGTATTVNTPKKDPLAELLKQNPDYASSVSSLQEYGYTDQQILDLANSGGLNALNTALHNAIITTAAERTAQVLNGQTVNVGAEKYQYLPSKQINCQWLSRQRISAILGIEDYNKLRGDVRFSSWSKFDGKEINGYMVDYEKIASGTKMKDLIPMLKTKQPCTAMFNFTGHCVTIDRIENGIVYWTDNFTSGGVEPYYKTGATTSAYDGTWAHRPYTGQIAYASLEDFAKYIDGCCQGSLTAYTTFTKTAK